MSHDTLLRTAALVAAASFLSAPYWDVIARHLSEAAKAANITRSGIARFAAACLLIYAACGSGIVPAVRNFRWSIANVVTLAQVVVGLAFVASAFVEAARLGQSYVRPSQ
jgi:hypothetical protein